MQLFGESVRILKIGSLLLNFFLFPKPNNLFRKKWGVYFYFFLFAKKSVSNSKRRKKKLYTVYAKC